MKKIKLDIDDNSILNNLYSSRSNLMADFKRREDRFLKIRYSQYLAYAYNHKLFSLPEIPNIHKARKEIFKDLYKSNLIALNYIKDYRTNTSFKICSLCGSPAAGTLDHFLPQDTYSEFSIFSKNLIPACKCNSSKNKKINMMYHPQFFEFLDNRLFLIKFQIVENAVNFQSIEPTIKSSHKYFQLINAHLENHILKCVKGFKNEMRTRLQSLYDTPQTHIFALDSVEITSKKQLKKIILQQLKRENQKFGTPNSWDSLILSSFLQKNIFGKLYLKIKETQT